MSGLFQLRFTQADKTTTIVDSTPQVVQPLCKNEDKELSLLHKKPKIAQSSVSAPSRQGSQVPLPLTPSRSHSGGIWVCGHKRKMSSGLKESRL